MNRYKAVIEECIKRSMPGYDEKIKTDLKLLKSDEILKEDSLDY